MSIDSPVPSNMKSQPWIMAWLFTLLFIYPIPHTVALRNLVLVAGVGGLAVAWWPVTVNLRNLGKQIAWTKPAAWMLAILTAWIVFQSAVISPFSKLALAQIPGGWLVPMLTALLGILAAARVRPRQAATALTLALGAHIVVFLLYQIGVRVHDGYWPIGHTPYAERDFHSLLNNFLLAILVADRLGRYLKQNAVLSLSSRLAWCLMLASLAADIFLSTRNGTLVTIALMVIAAAIVFRSQSKRPWLVLSAAVLFATLIAAGSLSVDKRWAKIGESIDAGLHSDSLSWLHPEIPRPLLSSGEPAEESAYLRSAWANKAFAAIEDHPLGLGYGHKAFGWAMEMKYGPNKLLSSHSGLLDFTLATGLPGIALWLALSAWLIRAGWRLFRREGSANGLLLLFCVSSYLLRCLIDAHFSGWRLAMYGLVIGSIIGTIAACRKCE